MFSGKPLISSVYRAVAEKVKNEILSQPDLFIQNSSTDDLVEYFLSNNHLQPIDIDISRNESIEHKKELRRVPAHQREDSYRSLGDTQFEYERIVVTIPLVYNPDIGQIIQFSPSTHSFSWSVNDANWHQDHVTFSVDIKGYGFKLEDQQIKNKVQFERERVHEWIGWAGTDIRRENETLRNFIRQTIEERRQKIKADESRIVSLSQLIGIPQRRSNEEIIQHIRIDKKPLVRRIKPSPATTEEYILDRGKVLDIIEIVDNQGIQFEKTPSSYKSLGENALRDILLSTLNSIFAGSATGETFSHKGRTDIYLRIDKGNILIFEGKFWGGQKLYQETIDQLLGYLTWRQNFGVIISLFGKKIFPKYFLLRLRRCSLIRHTGIVSSS
jgi:hypothetical protein